MGLTETIIYLNILFWLFPVFRQYREGLFYYFLVLAISDPTSLLLNYMGIHPMITASIFSFFAFISVIYYKKQLGIISLITFALISFFLTYSPDSARIGVFIFHGFILYHFMSMLARDMALNESINFYFIILLLYESSILLKISARIINAETGIYFFYITTAFAILIAIYFILFNFKNSPKINLSIHQNNKQKC